MWQAQFPWGPPAGGLTGADILVSPAFTNNFQLFAPGGKMGLNQQLPNDEVDALAVWDNPQFGGLPYIADPQIDIALFSLAPGSPYLDGPDQIPNSGDEFSAADIFVTDFTGQSWLYLSHRSIGMNFFDNVDAIDVETEFNMWEEPPLDPPEELPAFSGVPEPSTLILLGLYLLALNRRHKT